jgi:exonuclease SbcC
VERLKVARRDAERRGGAAALVQGLNPGDPCPVCGRPLREIPAAHDGAAELGALEAALAAAEADLLDKRSEYKALKERAENLETNLKRADAEAAKLRSRAARLEDERDALREDFRAALGEFEDPRPVLEDRRARLLAGLAADVLSVTGGRDPEALGREAAQERKRLQDALKFAEDGVARARAAATEARVKLETAQGAFSEWRAAAADAAARLERALEEHGFAGAAEAVAAALDAAARERLERSAAEHEEAVSRARSREHDARSRLGGRRADPDRLAALEEGVPALERRVSAALEALGAGRRSLEALRDKIRAAGQIRKRAADAGRRYDVLAALANDLKGNEFQEFMLAEVQRDLLGRASGIMREVTGERYTLELRDGEYLVADAWNAMEARSVRTLSGGESFIASLSLALALSDSLAGHRALGALFLDEGFGTLDAEALDAVAAVLEAIQTQGRMVGVITHVASLAERLPNRLVVQKGTGSSRVVWDA